MASDWDYAARLLAYTGIPIGVLAMLAIPSCLAGLLARSGSLVSRERFEETVSAFSWWGLFLVRAHGFDRTGQSLPLTGAERAVDIAGFRV